MSFVYKPQIFTGNKYVRHLLDDFTFSGSDIATAGQPIFLSMSGTVYNGSGTSYGSGGNIYGGAISSGSGVATTGRPPQIGRNSITGPGFNAFDLRVARNIPIHEKIYLQFSADAFNALNHRIVTSVNGTYSQYATASSSATAACSTAAGTVTGTTAPAGSVLQGCISPYSGTGLSAFGVPSATNNGLYGPRQMEFKANLYF